jgi:Zn-dependent alcohol dehydrogenase
LRCRLTTNTGGPLVFPLEAINEGLDTLRSGAAMRAVVVP